MKTRFPLFISGILGLLPAIAKAQQGFITGDIDECNFTTGRFGADCIPLYIAHLITLIFGLVGIFFIINIMYAGYQIAFGNIPGVGDKEAGKNRLLWSIIGFLVTACSFLILDAVLSIVIERI